MAPRLALTALVAAVTFALPSLARADTYCVNAPGCSGIDEPDLQSALSAAQSTTTVSDTVRVASPGPGTTGYTYTDGGNSANQVNIVGSGTSSTVLTRSGSGTVLNVTGSGSGISHLTVQLPDADAEGVMTSGSLDDVDITTLDTTNHTQLGAGLDGANATEHWSGGSIQMPGTGADHQGVSTGDENGVLTIQDVTVNASGLGFSSDFLNTVILRRVSILSPFGYAASGDTISMDDVTFVAQGAPGFFVQSSTGSGPLDDHLTLDHVSAFGNGVTNGVGLLLNSTVSGATLTAGVRNTILHGFPIVLQRNASGGGVANVGLAFDETDFGAEVLDDHNPGSGSTTDAGGNIGGDPLWANAAAGNFALQPGSPGIDHGDPAGLAAGESSADILGAPRISGGRLDIGAVELQQPPAPPPAVPDTTAPSFRTSKLPKKLTLKKLLAGITFTIVPSERARVDASLLGSASSVKLAKTYNLTLAHRTLGLAAGSRRVTLKVRKKLLGRSRRFSVQLKIVATDASGNARTLKRTIKVR